MAIWQKYYYISKGKNPDLIKGLPIQNTIRYYVSADISGATESESYNLYILSDKTLIKNYDSSTVINKNEHDEQYTFEDIKLHWRSLKGTGVACIKDTGLNYTETIVEITPYNNGDIGSTEDFTTYFLVVDFKFEYDYLKYQLPQKYLTLIKNELTKDEYMDEYIDLTMYRITEVSASNVISVNRILPDGEGDLTLNLYNLNDVDVVTNKESNTDPEYKDPENDPGRFLMLSKSSGNYSYVLSDITWNIIKGNLLNEGQPIDPPANPELYNYIIGVSKNAIDFGTNGSDINYYMYNIGILQNSTSTLELLFNSPTIASGGTGKSRSKTLSIISTSLDNIPSIDINISQDLVDSNKTNIDLKVSQNYIDSIIDTAVDNITVDWVDID